jgi:ABC-type multidrug transport system ATPase subunit/ABC-type multidrug transport system permease subunit
MAQVGKTPFLEHASEHDVENPMQQKIGDFTMLRKLSEKMNGGDNTTQMSMEWKDLSFSIGGKTILKNMTGLVEPGRLTCVLGPSGSGKSTLMNVLAGRQKTTGGNMTSSGVITSSGLVVNPVDFRGNIAYVMQDDSLMGTETPRECLAFSASMRLPKEMEHSEKDQFVSNIIQTLHLDKCQNTYVGNALMKGISGGERKRTSVGVELIANPRLLFLDEPLSGLDSYAAYTLVQALKELANSGVPVMCTVHQPSSEIFDMFDSVIILHDGEVAYHGPVQQLPFHFEKLGFPCKSNFNPADHVMFLMQKEPEETIRRIKDVWSQSEMSADIRTKVEQLQDARGGEKAASAIVVGGHTGFCTQLVALLKREIRGTMRNKGILFARYGMTLFLAIMYAWLFAGVGRKGDATNDAESNCLTKNFNSQNCQIDFQGHLGSLLSLAIATMMGAAQPVMLTFPQERPVFLREYAARQYGVVPYFVSKTLVEMPVILVAAALQFLVSYWLMGLQGNFLLLVIVSWLLAITSSALALIVGCGVASVEKAIQFGPLVLLPQMLFSGLFVPINSIPTSLRWVQYVCPLKYAINVLGIVEFWYVKEELDVCSPGGCPGFELRKGLLEAQSIYFDQWDKNLGLLIALYFAFRIMACTLLWRKGRYVF